MKNYLKNKTTIIAGIIILVGVWYFYGIINNSGSNLEHSAHAAKFIELSKNGNSACSVIFKDSIASMSDNSRIQGSCCSPMDLHRYTEQVEGLKKYKDVKEIPPDPYDIDVSLAKRL